MRNLTLEHPVAAGLGLLLVAGVFRLIDIFVLRLDERWGEIIISKVLAVLLLSGFLVSCGAGLQAAGLHSRAALPSLALGVGLTSGALLLGYVADLITLARHGAGPVLQLAPIDPKTGMAGAAAFGVLLVAGNLINSFAEEGLFRGVLIPLLRRDVSPWLALMSSALAFGLWHLPWAVKAVASGSASGLVAARAAVIANFLPQTLLGLVWGYLYMRTGNLWGSWAAHTLTNSALNFVHVRSSEGIDTGLPVRMVVFSIIMLLGMAVIWHVSKRYQLLQVQPWRPGG